MIKVRIIKSWDYPDLFRQTPGSSGEWDDIKCVFDDRESCDYVVVLNTVTKKEIIECRGSNIWAMIQEPMTKKDIFPWAEKGHENYARVYTDNYNLKGPRYRLSHTALPWHVDKDYEYLKACNIPHKTRDISWVTSNLSFAPGYRKRLQFLDSLKESVDIDIWGRGFSPIKDKWDGLAPYKYSIAFENQYGPHYWTEKLTDCFLAWTLPIYYGCSNIFDYFPEESMIYLGEHPEDCKEKILDAIATNQWEKRQDAIRHARDLVLDKHQFFPFLSSEINEHRAKQDNNIRTVILTPEKRTTRKKALLNRAISLVRSK